MKSCRVILTLGLLLWGFGAAPVLAAPDGWTLALSWQAGFCATRFNTAECGAKPSARLVLHGLWPEGGADYCRVSVDQRTLDDKRHWCKLAPLDLSRETAATLKRVMPGTESCLERHEWVRHGTCSGLAADDYFELATRLVEHSENAAIGRFLHERSGGVITLNEVKAAFAKDFGAENAGALNVICAKSDGITRLLELRISLGPKGPWTYPARTAVRPGRTQQRCPANGPIILDGR